eukprot:4312476-Amphidinium_carterae.1
MTGLRKTDTNVKFIKPRHSATTKLTRTDDTSKEISNNVMAESPDSNANKNGMKPRPCQTAALGLHTRVDSSGTSSK